MRSPSDRDGTVRTSLLNMNKLNAANPNRNEKHNFRALLPPVTHRKECRGMRGRKVSYALATANFDFTTPRNQT